MSLMYCPKDIEHTDKIFDDPYCRQCGVKTRPLPTCCKTRFYPWDKFCSQCGKPVQFPQAEEGRTP